MRIKIRDYRAIERADLDLERIALIAGRNEVGKSSLAQAVQAVLAAAPIPIPGVLKKDAKVLVREGAGEGTAIATSGAATYIVEWPKATYKTDSKGGVGLSSDFAVGLRHPFDLDPDARARELATYVKAMPGKADLETAAADIGYHETAIAKLWDSVKAGGQTAWDATHKKAREWGTNMRGRWEGATGETYGSKKGGEWTPVNLPPPEATREALVSNVGTMREALEDVIRHSAVSDAEIARLKTLVAAAATNATLVPEYDEAIDANEEKLSDKENERRAIPADSAKPVTVPTAHCPHCNVLLAVDPGPVLSIYVEHAPAAPASTRDLQTERREADNAIAKLKSTLRTLRTGAAQVEAAIKDGAEAEARLLAIGENKGHDRESIELARTNFATAEAVLAAFDAKLRADDLHAQITMNDKLVALLAPDGLRRRKLAAALKDFNELLSATSDLAGWPVVRFDDTLNPHYGTRPVWAASDSGQWRARTVVQIALAQLDGSAAIVIDKADMLVDNRSRSGLFDAIVASGLRAVVCMAFAKPELVPDLRAAGLGRSYWISGGVAIPLDDAR